MESRAYDLVRSMVERLGGSMTFEHEGYRYGAWVIKIGKNTLVIKAGGNRSFPELDQLYTPRVKDPKHWDDYYETLIEDAEKQLYALLSIPYFPDEKREKLTQLIERTKWKFAWTYARTYPHEYTTKALCKTADHSKLIDTIEKYGIIQRFGDSYRKYFYFEDRKYWHMGEPDSDDPEEQPNVINRTWVDVRRHAENVKHRWTEEEVELQQRLWEIQLEKSTDRNKSKKKT